MSYNDELMENLKSTNCKHLNLGNCENIQDYECKKSIIETLNQVDEIIKAIKHGDEN